MKCSAARLKALLGDSDELTPSDCARLKRHLADCAACRAWVDGLSETLGSRQAVCDPPPFAFAFHAAMQRAADADAHRSPWLLPVPIWGATAAAVIVVALLLLRPPLPAGPEPAGPAVAAERSTLPGPDYPSGLEIDLDLRTLDRRILKCALSDRFPSDYLMRRVIVEGAIRRMRTSLEGPSTSNTSPDTNEPLNPSGGTS